MKYTLQIKLMAVRHYLDGHGGYKLLFEKKSPKLALRVLSSIADLDIENEELYKLLAYKLKEGKFYDNFKQSTI